MTKDETIDKLWEQSNHGTRREDVVAAYNAGAMAERDSVLRSCNIDVAHILEPLIEKRVAEEREACAKVCEALELVFECQSAQPGYWPGQIAHKCAVTIRERSNDPNSGAARGPIAGGPLE